MEINNTNDLVNLLNSGEQKNKKIVIKNDITINSNQIPDIGYNVNLTNCIVTGEGEKRPTITIETKEQDIQPLFGKILGDPQDVTDKNEQYPVLQNFNVVCKGDVIGSAVCAEVDSKVGEDFKKYNHLGYAKNIGIRVEGNILPYEYYTNYYKAGAFAIDWTEFDFYNIDINVNGNIGDENRVFDKDVLVGGLFAENGGYKTLRLENINIKAKNLVAKTNAPGYMSAAAGVAVTGDSYRKGKVKVFGKKINVDVENIISSNAGCSNGKMNSFAAVGFLDNTKTFVTDQTMMSVSIGIAPWNIVSRDVELGINNPVEVMAISNDNYQLYSLPMDVDESTDDPFFIKMNEIAGGSDNKELLVYPRVINSNFKANNVEVTSAGNCGSVYYGVGNLMNVVDTNISVGKIKMNTNLPNFAGISVSSYLIDSQDKTKFPPETSDNNMKIGSIEINPISDSFATKDAYLSIIGHVGNHVSNNKIDVGDIKIDINSDNLLKINTGLNRAYTVKDNDIKVKSLDANVNGSKNNLGKIAFSGFISNIDINEKTGMTVENNRLAFDNDINLKGNAGSFFAGMIKDDHKGVLKNNTALFKNINLISNRSNEFSGLMSAASSSSSNIENNSLQVLGNIRLMKSSLSNYLAGILLEDTGNCSIIKDNTLLVMGSVINEGTDGAKEDFTSLGVGYVDWTGAGTQILGNAIYVHDKIENGPSVNFSYLAENYLIDNYNGHNTTGMFALKNNSIMLKNIPEGIKDETLANGAMAVGAQNNVFVHVNGVNRDAYKIDGNGKLNMDKKNLIGTMKIAPREFQDKLWSHEAINNQIAPEFDYILNRNELGQVEFISRDKDELLNGGNGEKLYLNDFYRRHLAAKNDGIIYDILGIPSEAFIVKYDLNGGSLIDPSKPIEDKNYYSFGTEAVVLGAENAAYRDRKFLGWSLDPNAEKGEYLPGSKIVIKGNTILYAIWEGDKKPEEPENVVPVLPKEEKGKPLFPWLEIGNYENYDADKKQDPKTHMAYIFGYPDKTIRPEGNITRAEAAALVIRLAELDTNENLGKFSDTEVEAWYNKYVNLAYERDMLLAEDNKIRPNEKITRAEFAKLISKVDKENSKELPFADVKGHQFEKEIQQAYANGRIEGYPDGSFKPDGEITRTEAVKILNSLFERSADKDYINDNQDKIKKFIDLDRSHWGYYELVEAANTHKYVRREAGKVDERCLEILEYIEKNIKQS
ncbi:S-layer homology domain-containing protein [Peptoniphilus obesi]|uniref:S-layer homology domain-containing protein n=1 Tax=Peptoniphilus obesi TaxID=1472765 RepID=UPI00155A2F76|nr:S-layer homology domain-containing protein [Peptoniphilus obesi]